MRLPSCSATQILRRKFGVGSDARLIEKWVNFTTGIPDRTEVYRHKGINRVVKNYQVGIKDDDLLNFDGQFSLENGHKVIYIKSNLGEKRRRFTLAHELGHVAFYALAPELNQNVTEVERLCDIFAAELMMPVRMVRKLAEAFRGPELVLTLAKMAGASLPAACIRVNECLGITSGLATLDGNVIENYGHLPDKLNPSGELTARLRAAAEHDYCGPISVDDWQLDWSVSGNMRIYTVSPLPTAA